MATLNVGAQQRLYIDLARIRSNLLKLVNSYQAGTIGILEETENLFQGRLGTIYGAYTHA